MHSSATQPKTQPLSLENALKQPLLKGHEEALTAFFTRKDSVVFPRKHLAALKMDCHDRLRKVRSLSPNIAAKDALVEILKGISAKTPPDMLLQLTKYILSEWSKMEVNERELMHS